MAEPIHIEDSTFQKTVLENEHPVIVDFWAPWCTPCKMMAPVLEELSQEYDGKIQFVKLNTDENYEAATLHGIQSLPTLVIFRQGREVARIVGFAPKNQLKRQIDRALEAAPQRV
ncbi:MAG: thioredoxin [Chloroflexia bacterium]